MINQIISVKSIAGLLILTAGVLLLQMLIYGKGAADMVVVWEDTNCVLDSFFVVEQGVAAKFSCPTAEEPVRVYDGKIVLALIRDSGKAITCQRKETKAFFSSDMMSCE